MYSSMLRTTVALLSLLGLTAQVALCRPESTQTRAPKFARARTQAVSAPDCEPNRLIVAPRAGADADEQNDAIQNVHGRIINTISNGHLTFHLVEVEPGYLPEAYRKLSKDTKDFSAVQLNYNVYPEAFPATAPNDPIYPQSYWLNVLNVPKAWALPGAPSGKNVVIGLLDTGVDATQADLKGKVLTGFNAYAGSGPGNVDTDTASTNVGHGSACASLMVGNTNNGTLGCGIAYNATINPVIISSPSNPHGTIYTITSGLLWLEKQGVRIVNASYTGIPPYQTLTNLDNQPAWKQAVVDFYTKYNGLLFCPAGNSGTACTNCSPSNDLYGYDTNARTVYVVPTSGFDSTLKLANFSVIGTPLWFGGPAVNIVVTGLAGKTMTISGTSAASPMVCAIAALCLGAKSTMTNSDILVTMAQHCTQVPKQSSGTNAIISGMGIPDANAILKTVLGLK